MNKLFKILVYLLSGAGLLTASFLVFASVAGIPLSTLPLIGSFFPEPEMEASAPPDPATLEAQIDLDRRPPDQVLEASANPLHSFQLEGPWSPKQLEGLELRLEARIATLEERTHALKVREREQDERERRYDVMFMQLEVLKERLSEQSDEGTARQEELDTEAMTVEATRRDSLKRAAVLYEEGDDTALAAKQLLATYAPEDVGEVLRNLEPERVAELLREISEMGDPIVLRKVTAAYTR